MADRFHITKNLGEALEELLTRLYTELCALVPVPAERPCSPVVPSAGDPPTPPPTPAAALPAAPPARPCDAPLAPPAKPRTPAQRRSRARQEARRAAHQAHYAEVRRLHALGWTQQAIGAHLDLSSKTIRRWLGAPRFPERRPRPPPPRPLDPYKAYLAERWAQGCRNAAQLARELQARGYRGGRTAVRDYLAPLRPARAAAAPATPPAGLPRPRQLKWLLLRPVEELTAEESALVQQLCAASQEVTFAYGLVSDFLTLVRTRQADQLASWVAVALASGVAELGSFARGILRDFAAVRAGLELDWNQGVVEGNVNRLKMLKRQQYGRAKFDLLRLRVLYAH